MRERLIELLQRGGEEYHEKNVLNTIKVLKEKHHYSSETDRMCSKSEFLADYLLENGVVVPPCKVGDKVFLLLERTKGGYDIAESMCVRVVDNGHGKWYSLAFDCVEIGNTLEADLLDFGKWVFTAREAAENALKEREKA